MLSYSVRPKLALYTAIREYGLHSIWAISFSHATLLLNSSVKEMEIIYDNAVLVSCGSTYRDGICRKSQQFSEFLDMVHCLC